MTTFGVDGALVDQQGQLLYPIISWKCPRTTPVMADIGQYISARRLQTLSGVGQFSFNTLYKLVWLKEQHPALLERAHRWLFISSLINQRLTGRFTTDRTMAGTSQLLDLHQQDFSPEILQAIGIDRALFPPLISPGEQVGILLPEMARQLGLPAGIPVIAAGHDTQFALYGSGAGLDQPVLSSGTWEILMARVPRVNSGALAEYEGSTCELDSSPGLYNPGLQWLASGVLEWVRKLYWPGEPREQAYRSMIAEASLIAPGCNGVRMDTRLLGNHGGWQGVNLNTVRGHFYRAALESLAWQLRQNLCVLQRIAGFEAQNLLLVGGGSRNPLWNQIKADVLGIPVRTLDNGETTVLGAALFAWGGIGYYPSPDQARAAVPFHYHDYFPGEQHNSYRELSGESSVRQALC